MVDYVEIEEDIEAIRVASLVTPVAVGVEAHRPWQMYKGGVIRCEGRARLSHGVVVIGYNMAADNDENG